MWYFSSTGRYHGFGSFHRQVVSSTGHFIDRSFHRQVVSSTGSFHRQVDIMDLGRFIDRVISSTGHFIDRSFHRQVVSSTGSFYRHVNTISALFLLVLISSKFSFSSCISVIMHIAYVLSFKLPRIE